MRSNSVAIQELEAENRRMNEERELARRRELAVQRRLLFETSFRRLAEQVEHINEFTLVQLQDFVHQMEHYWNQFETQHLAVMAESQDVQAENEIFTAVETMYLATRRQLRARIAELEPQPMAVAGAVQAAPVREVRVELPQQEDNIPNTWGEFSGDFAEWHSFRDRFKAAIHENDRVRPIRKFQLLTAAMKGTAKNIVGNYKLTEANYLLAWARLSEVFEDDYLAIQQLVNRLLSLPRLTVATYNGLRQLIDTTHECLHQLSNFVPVEQWDPFIVFMVIDRLDPVTYDVWESQRPRERNQEGGMEVEPPEEAPAVVQARRVPTWRELEVFLDRRARISMHADVREGVDDTSSQASGGARKKFKTGGTQQPQIPRISQAGRGTGNERQPTGYPPCVMCKQDHALFRCGQFTKMDLAKRREVVNKFKLCRGCLKIAVEGHNCTTTYCPLCPNNQQHNSVLCPTREANRRANTLIAEQKPSGSGLNKPEKKQKKKK